MGKKVCVGGYYFQVFENACKGSADLCTLCLFKSVL